MDFENIFLNKKNIIYVIYDFFGRGVMKREEWECWCSNKKVIIICLIESCLKMLMLC